MTATEITIGLAIITPIATGLVFLLNKLVAKARHETGQDDKINLLVDQRQECFVERERQIEMLVGRLEKLENQDKDREITIISIKEKMESLVNAHGVTQEMIAQLTNNQQKTFSELIKTIGEMAK